MATTQFDRDSMARRYAKAHLKTDPGVAFIYYLPTGAGEREIRLIEINTLMGDRTDNSLEPIDFGVDRGSDDAHQLMIVDVTPEQWDRIVAHELPLPVSWSLEGKVRFADE